MALATSFAVLLARATACTASGGSSGAARRPTAMGGLASFAADLGHMVTVLAHGLTALAAGCPGLLRGELVSGALLVGYLAALLACLSGLLRGELVGMTALM